MGEMGRAGETGEEKKRDDGRKAERRREDPAVPNGLDQQQGEGGTHVTTDPVQQWPFPFVCHRGCDLPNPCSLAQGPSEPRRGLNQICHEGKGSSFSPNF